MNKIQYTKQLVKKYHRFSKPEEVVFFEYLQENVCTATMASEALHIPQKHITRYKARLQRDNKLWIVAIAPCYLTGITAQWLTTNPSLITMAERQLMQKGGNL